MIEKKKLIKTYIATSTTDEVLEDILDKIGSVNEELKAVAADREPILPSDEHLVRLIRPLIPVVEDGKSPTDAELRKLIKPLIPKPEKGEPGLDGTEIKAEEVRDKLKSLKDKHRLSVYDLKDTEYLEGKGRQGLQFTSAVNNLITDSTLTGNGTTASPLHVVSASGGSPVREENVASSGTGVSYTLAHIPLTGSLALFRGGSRITVYGGDYTISGKNITLASSLSSGETLSADYAY